MKRMAGLISMILTISWSLCSLAGPGKKAHPFSWADMFAMVRLADPQPSPDGSWILYTRTAYDVESNKGNTDLAMVAADGSKSRRLTHSPTVEANGRFSPDGRWVYFLSNRSDSMQLWRLPLDGGEASQVSDLPVSLEGFELNPAGDGLVFWAQVFPDCKTLECTSKRMQERAQSPVKAMVFDKLFIRHWDTWFDGRRNHLFVMKLKELKPRDLTPAWDQDTPTRPWGGSEEFAFAPDGKTLAFASKPSKDEAWHTNTEIYLTSLVKRGKPRCITSDNKAWDTLPVFSPDGNTLAYLAMDRPGFEADRFHIVLHDMKSAKKKQLTSGWDRSVREMVFSADGQKIYALAPDTARVRLFAVDLSDGSQKLLDGEGVNRFLALSSKGELVFMKERMVHPREVFVHNPATGKTRQVSRVNQAQLDKVRLSQPEEFWVEHDGFKIHGWLLKPVGFKKGRKYPLAFLVHGGPQGFWGDSFHYRWNPQFYAGAGYAVVGIDFRGSSSYGQKFQDANRANWGEGPYSDLMAGLKHALAQNKFIDPKRMCALGASYGGYMVNWIAGQDHPFKCLVNHDGDFDLVSAYFNTEELWFPEWEMTGPPWKAKEIYEKNSPMQFVNKWKTPMLVIQGALDFRVVETEAFATFNALQRQGVPSKLLYFPDENHWVLKPQNSRLWHKTVLDWIDRWTRTKRK